MYAAFVHILIIWLIDQIALVSSLPQVFNSLKFTTENAFMLVSTYVFPWLTIWIWH